MQTRFLPLSVVLDRVCLSKSQLYRKIRAGEFPLAVPLGPQKIGFLEAEVEQWMAERLKAREAKLNTRTLLMATGNNLRCLGDMARRAVVCRMDAKMANPEERQFDFDPVAEVCASRLQLVIDALTVLRAYIAAGRPTRLSAYGSFDDWDLVRGALVWLGEPDPLDTKAMVTANDPKLQERSELIFALHCHFGAGRRFLLSEIDGEDELSPHSLKGPLGRMLRSGRWHKGEAGALLAGHKEVPFMGLTLMARPNRIRVNEWWLEGVPEAAFVDEVNERKSKNAIPF